MFKYFSKLLCSLCIALGLVQFAGAQLVDIKDQIRQRVLEEGIPAELKLKAEQGNVDAQILIADLYEIGLEDAEKAMYWYLKMAGRDVRLSHEARRARYKLATIYCNGLDDFEPDALRCEYWLLMTGTYSNSDDQLFYYYVGEAYMHGFGVLKPDIEKAIHWYELAAKEGSKGAEVYLASFALCGFKKYGLYMAGERFDEWGWRWKGSEEDKARARALCEE